MIFTYLLKRGQEFTSSCCQSENDNVYIPSDKMLQ